MKEYAPGRWRRVALSLLAMIAVATLAPIHGSEPPQPGPCLICGERGAADALLNVLLFIPLGFALARSGAGWLAVVLVVGFSLAIESAQLFIPGRDASLGDVVFDSAGGVVGLLSGWARSWPGVLGRLPGCLTVPLGAGAAGLIVLTGVLLEPSMPDSVYFGQWTPELGHLDAYDGEVMQATVGSQRVPPWRLQNSAEVRDLLQRGAPLEVRFTAGVAPDGLAPVFSIHDQEQVEVVLVGVQGEDLVYRYRTLAATLRLDQPDFRIRMAMAGGRPGDVSRARVWGGAGGLCLSLNETEACPVGPTPGMGWAFLFYPDRGPHRWVPFLSVLWLFVLTVPVGFAGGNSKATAAGAALPLLALILIPRASLLNAVTAWEATAALLGIVSGVVLRLSMAGAGGGRESPVA